MSPLISVVMPVYNAADTLAFALASLQAQTYTNWECIVIDDGSMDNPKIIINIINDPRIQYHRLERNYGRGYARQRAVEIAKGKYLAFLDADDWIYPDKFRDQVQFLENQPDIVLVSTGMAISDMQYQLAGVRPSTGKDPVFFAPMKQPGMPPLAFPPTMMITDLAKQTGFDIAFVTAEDVDFLLRALHDKPFAVLPTPLYVYREQGSTTLAKVSPALNYCCRMFLKQFNQSPLQSSIEIFKALGKKIIYHLANVLGFWDYMISRRSQIASEADHEKYQLAYQAVSKIAASYAQSE